MALWERLARLWNRDLDKQVHGTEGEARARYERLRRATELIAEVTLGDAARGAIALVGHPHPKEPEQPRVPRRESGEGRLLCSLGEARLYAGTELTVEARPHGAPASYAVAALVVRLFQRDPETASDAAEHEVETFSIESRYDASGEAFLKLVIALRHAP